MLSIKRIIEIEPKVKSIFDLEKTKRNGGYKAYEESGYVGFNSNNSVLKSTEAYELCINRVATILKI